MFATLLAKQLECLSQVLVGSTQPLTHELSQAGLALLSFLAADALPISGETHADNYVAPDSDS